MKVKIIDSDQGHRLILDGSLTRQFSAEMEAAIIGAMRRYPRLKVDLSGVREIDHCGIHLLSVMRRVGGKEVDFVATSPAVDKISPHFMASRHGSHYLPATARTVGRAQA